MEWSILIDKEIISHIKDDFYLQNLCEVLQAKIDTIRMFQSSQNAVNEILADKRTIAFLSACNPQTERQKKFDEYLNVEVQTE